jgi:hypothetical protein
MNYRNDYAQELGDFTATPRMISISLLAIGIGLVSTVVAWALLRMIAFFTNAFYYGRVGTAMISPAASHLGWFGILVPVAGGLIIGLMARYGSDRIRGHGIPEALVVDPGGGLRDVITRKQVQRIAASGDAGALLGDIAVSPVVAYVDEPLRLVVTRMAESGLTRLPVVEAGNGTRKLAGMISLDDLLKARARNLTEERRLERVLHVRFGPGREFLPAKS